VGQVKGSIDEKAIPKFKSAVKWVMQNHWQELHSTFKREDITFCAFGYGGSKKKGCEIILDGYSSRSDYSGTLKKSLEMIDDWATKNPSEELKAVWSGSAHYPLKTCHEVVLSNHERLETAAQPVDLKELHDILA
jgi:hypothetical protein